MFKAYRFLKEYKFPLIVGPAFKLTEAILELFVPLVMAKIIDVGIKNNDLPYVLRMGGLMILLGILGLGCALICQYQAAKASQGYGTVLRRELFSKINTLSKAQIDRIGTGSLITRLTNDTNQLQLSVAMLIRLVVRAPFLVIGAAIMALAIDVQLSSIFFLAIPLIVLVLYLVMSRSIPLYKRVQEGLDRISKITQEGLSGIRVIRAFSRQQAEVERFEDSTEAMSKAAVRVGRLSALLNPLTFLIMNVAIIAIVWFGGQQVDIGRLEQGQIIALVQYMTQILLALVVVANLVIIFTKAAASAKRVNEVFDLQPEITDAGNTEVQCDREAPSVVLDHLSFSYHNNGDYDLEDLSLTLPKGQTLGIIGGTGAGKTTLVNLLLRYYDAQKGKILVDGVDVRKYPFVQLRRKIGLVPQKAVLFGQTLRENMRWGKEDASDEEIWKALRTAQAADFVQALPEGLDYLIAQDGKNLSGGQRQRLTIARALVGDPDILILDDSASALDFATDAALRRALKEDLRDKTVLLISQRTGSIRHADQILVLDDGKVAGLGRHEELLDTCPLYEEIHKSQVGSEEVRR